jgi:hypothetical protein
MRHRLYYLLPDIDSARRTRDDMLLARIEQRHIHFMSEKIPLPTDLPEANVLHKTDVVHGAESGMIVGAILGMLFGAFIIWYFELQGTQAVVILGTTAFGLFFGGWAASLVAAALPNTRLQGFAPDLEKGKILMIADVPARRVEEIEKMLEARHPEMRFGGEEPHIPVFP